jgi:hypothetical protein
MGIVSFTHAQQDERARSTSTYPTTVTHTYTRTSTSKLPRGLTHDESKPTTAVLFAVNLVEPWPSSPDPEEFPYTLTQTGYTKRYDVAVSAGSTATLSSADVTATSTWVLWDTAATDLPKGRRLPKCEGCAVHAGRRDPRCKDKGRETACHSQCKIRDVEGRHVWWCHKRMPGDGSTEVNIGRVCADGTKWYQQLYEPCHVDDLRHDCPPCLDRDEL